jgi:hypothetical protein
MTLLNAVQVMDTSELNELIVAIKERRGIIARDTTNSLVKGDVVSFDGGNKRGIITGVVHKVNLKTVVVQAGSHHWKVSASLLTREDVS